MDKKDTVKTNNELINNEFINDRLGEYLIPYLEEYLFDELSDSYLEKAGAKDILSGIPVPIKKTELTELTNIKIARSMAMVMGCDVNFPHKEAYRTYINRVFGKDFVLPLLNEGVELAANGDYERACICFRGAFMLDNSNVDAVYCYGRSCKEAYENGEGEEYVGRFKAESLEAFERMTLMAPTDERGYYFLGYAYLNLGLYMKAKLTFEEYLKLADVEIEETAGLPDEFLDDREDVIEEVKTWIAKLDAPVEIEKAYNMVLSGRYHEGIESLLPYTENKQYKDWWPLYYYLGTAYKNLNDYEAAIKHFKKVLEFAPSDINTMEELVELYDAVGDSENREKYSSKIKVVQRNLEEERAERNPDVS